ncbi:transcriptional regulator domain-containing protein [Afipia carboxidovorans]|uniref:transcriptional regulator domain-containing protein n=1 Tax=Afipia carboxidovorans TaxID=40137 RepID=UPI0026BD3765
MEPLQDWRSSQFENELGHLDRGGVSFEFLRRNGQYRQDYAAALTEIAAGGTTRTEAIDRLSRRWGLAFPSRPFCIGSDRASCVAGAMLPCHADCQCCPGRLRGCFAA